MLAFRAWEGFCKGVSNHIFHGTVNKFEFSLGDDPVYEMEMDVNMLCVCMVLVVASECDCTLIITIKCHWPSKFPENFSDQRSEPKHFFGSMGSCHILCLGH